MAMLVRVQQVVPDVESILWYTKGAQVFVLGSPSCNWEHKAQGQGILVQSKANMGRPRFVLVDHSFDLENPRPVAEKPNLILFEFTVTRDLSLQQRDRFFIFKSRRRDTFGVWINGVETYTRFLNVLQECHLDIQPIIHSPPSRLRVSAPSFHLYDSPSVPAVRDVLDTRSMYNQSPVPRAYPLPSLYDRRSGPSPHGHMFDATAPLRPATAPLRPPDNGAVMAFGEHLIRQHEEDRAVSPHHSHSSYMGSHSSAADDHLRSVADDHLRSVAVDLHTTSYRPTGPDTVLQANTQEEWGLPSPADRVLSMVGVGRAATATPQPMPTAEVARHLEIASSRVLAGSPVDSHAHRDAEAQLELVMDPAIAPEWAAPEAPKTASPTEMLLQHDVLQKDGRPLNMQEFKEAMHRLLDDDKFMRVMYAQYMKNHRHPLGSV